MPPTYVESDADRMEDVEELETARADGHDEGYRRPRETRPMQVSRSERARTLGVGAGQLRLR